MNKEIKFSKEHEIWSVVNVTPNILPSMPKPFGVKRNILSFPSSGLRICIDAVNNYS